MCANWKLVLKMYSKAEHICIGSPDFCGMIAVKTNFVTCLMTNSEVHEQAIFSCAAVHHERRILLKQEIGRMVLFFTDQPSLLAPNIQVRCINNLFSVFYLQ